MIKEGSNANDPTNIALSDYSRLENQRLNRIYLSEIIITYQFCLISALVISSLSSGAEDSEEINEDYDKGYSELNNEIDGQVIEKSYFPYQV